MPKVTQPVGGRAGRGSSLLTHYITKQASSQLDHCRRGPLAYCLTPFWAPGGAPENTAQTADAVAPNWSGRGLLAAAFFFFFFSRSGVQGSQNPPFLPYTLGNAHSHPCCFLKHTPPGASAPFLPLLFMPLLPRGLGLSLRLCHPILYDSCYTTEAHPQRSVGAESMLAVG